MLQIRRRPEAVALGAQAGQQAWSQHRAGAGQAGDVGVDELLAIPVHDADVHLAGMQINSAVEFRSRGVVLHGCSSS